MTNEDINKKVKLVVNSIEFIEDEDYEYLHKEGVEIEIKKCFEEIESLRTQLAKTNEDYKALFSAFESCQDELKKANESIKELTKSEEKERLRKEYAFRMEENLIQENKELKRQRFRTYSDEEYIIFFDDGEDYPDSMVAPVVMSADKFRELFYAREQLRKEQSND